MREQAAAGGDERRGDHQRERGDDDLEGEQRLEAEHRQVAAAVHAQRQRREDAARKIAPGSEPPWLARSWMLSPPTSTATASTAHTPTATSSAGGRSSAAPAARAPRGARASRLRAVGSRLVAASAIGVRLSRARVEPLAQRSRRALGILGGGDRAQHAHARCARVDHLVRGCPRPGRRSRRTAPARGRPRSGSAPRPRPGARAWSASAWIGPDADVVDDARVDRVDLRGRVRGQADSMLRADELAHLRRRACRPGPRARRRRPPRAPPRAGR